MTLPPPAVPDRYRIIREVGRGGMATVYLAEDTRHQRQVALKSLDVEFAADGGAERFLQEIQLMAGLQHPHVLPLFDSGEVDGRLFYVMPFVEGESLRVRLDREGPLPIDDALAIAADVASALDYAHGHGVVHRDVKPENILLSGDEALVADFGIALALAGAGRRLTGSGISLGTPGYMSPEQIAGERSIDGRSDQYALGCLLFEMLVGEPPFHGGDVRSVLARAVAEPAPGVRSRRAEVPITVDAAIARALAKAPDERFPSCRALIDAATPPAATAGGSRRAVLVGLAVTIVAIAVAWPLWTRAETARARASIATIAGLASNARYGEAYALAERAERRLPGDSAVAALMAEVSDAVSVTTTPAGARVLLQRMPDAGAARGDSVEIGVTPIREQRVARGDYRMRVALEGHVPVERIVSSAFRRSGNAVDKGRQLSFEIAMLPAGSVPAEMVHVPGGRYTLVSPDMPLGQSAALEPYLLDRFEVTNHEYRAFVRDGGYGAERWWQPDGANAGPSRAGLVDQTGLPSPRAWSSQEPPAGRGDHPVTGVTWREARAFCIAGGKRLPTMFEWEKGARDGAVSKKGVVMPWGYTAATGATERRANFNGTGTMPVNAHPFGLSAYGAYDMAGNVKEWIANPVGTSRAATGGSWQDPAYVYTQVGVYDDTVASPAIGFRCARDLIPGASSATAQGGGPLVLSAPPTVYRPVDPATYRSLLAFYRYDPRPANPRGVTRTETPDWTRERVWIDGVGGDSVLAYLYLPRRARPPFQMLVSVPSSAAFFFEPVWRGVEDGLGPHIKAGRAVLAVVMDGMIERPPPVGFAPPPPASVGFRDLMVRHATELRMGIDYALTRPEIDSARLAYIALSWGAGSRLPFAAVEDRFKAVVLVGAGIDERVQPTLPEAANFNFAPYIRVPKLMLNGRQDEEHPWLSRAQPLWTLLREPRELVLLDGVGHHPPAELRAPPINAFLDRVLGPVRTGTP